MRMFKDVQLRLSKLVRFNIKSMPVQVSHTTCSFVVIARFQGTNCLFQKSAKLGPAPIGYGPAHKPSLDMDK